MTSCMQKTRQIFANMQLTLTSEANVLNSKHAGSRGQATVGGHLFCRLDRFMDKKKLFKSGQFYMKDAESAEINEKSFFSFLLF